MDDRSQTLTTRTGFRFQVRPAEPADEAALADFFTHVTPDDVRFRFLTGLSAVCPDRIADLVRVDHTATENFLAFDADHAVMIATAMLACDATLERGEVAICLHKDYKHRGVGWELLAHIARVAAAKGVRCLESIEAHDNRAAIALEREMGFTAEPYPGDPALVLVRRRLAPSERA